MPEFARRVGTPSGAVHFETHVAESADALRADLVRRDLHVFEITRRGAGISVMGLSLGGGARRVPRRQFLLFNQELVTLLRAGLPLLQCLDVVLERMTPGPFRRYLTDIKERVQGGSALSDAFQAQGEAFPRVYSAALTAGERSGELAGVMARYVTFAKKSEQIRTRVTAAMIYPLILSCMSFGLICLLMFYILPKFSSFYSEFDAQLPTITVIVMAMANWLRAHVVIILPTVIVLAAAARAWSTTPRGETFFDAMRLRIPVLGPVIRMYNVAQFSRTLSTLLAGGIPLVSALQTTAGAMTKKVFTKALAGVQDNVTQGKSLWESIERTGVYTDLTVEMCKVGEATGSLGTMLGNVAEFYDEQVDDQLTRIVSFFEPLLLVTMGLIVATILLAMYLPIFRLAGSSNV